MADSQDGQPLEERSQTPDLQGAGMPAISAPDTSLLAMLGSMGGGTMNAGMLPPPPSQASVYAQALSGGISAMRGTPDPVQKIISDGQQQQNVIAQMMMKMGEQQRLATQWGITNQRLQREEDRRESHTLFEEADKRSVRARELTAFQLKVYDGQLASATDPDTRRDIARKRAKVEEQALGVPVPENVIEGWALPSPVSKERDDQIKQAFAVAGADPVKQQVVAQQFRLDPQSVNYYLGLVSNPALIGLKTVQDLRRKDVDDQVAEEQLYDLRAKRAWPEMVGDQKFAMAMRAMSQTLYPNQKYVDLGEREKTAVFNAVHAQAKLEEAEKIRLTNDAQTQKLLTVLGARQDNLKDRPTPLTVMDKHLAPYTQGETFLKSIAQLRSDLKGIPDGALPSGDDLVSQLWAQSQRGLVYRNNESLKNFQLNWGPMTVGFDRGYFDDKGQKSVRVFDAALKVADTLPPRKTIEAYLTRMESLLKERMGSHLAADSVPEAQTPADVLAKARFITAPYLKQAPSSPLAPLSMVRRFMDMRKGSATYGKTVEAEVGAGDAIPPGYIEVK